MRVEDWLKGLGLEQYASAFVSNGVDVALLTELTNEDLKDLSVDRLADRKKILSAIAQLSEGQDQAESDPSPPATLEGERRQVTVLFADLSGFTKLSNELGAEATHTLLNRYFEVVDGIVEDYGGRVDKHIGDNVMAVFGAPIAHTDDPERAVRAALDIHQAMIEISDTVGRDLYVHIGVASGQVVASGTGSDAHREYTVTGDSVNLASRLQDKAALGETYISDAVQRAIGELVISEAMDEVEIKGLGQPVRAWRVQGLQAEMVDGSHRPFVGRRSELSQFAGVLSACSETGGGQTIYVRGEAGIGKTRLVEEMQHLAVQNGFTCHIGLVLDFGVGKGQDAIRTLVRRLLEIPPAGGKEVRGIAADRALTEGLLSSDRRVYLNDLLNLEQPTDLHTLYDAMDNATRNRGKQDTVVELLQMVSAIRPTLVVIEDLHWADPLVLAHVAKLASAVTECQAVMIMTSRVEGGPIDQAWRGAAGGSPLMTIDLAPLREAEALELAAEYLDTTNRFALTCIERAAGNPLFLDQLLRSSEETGEAEIPGSVQSIVLARMDHLDALDKRALQAASVIGQRFTLDSVRHLIDTPQYTCAELVEHLLVRPQDEDYLFAHALVRDGVYSSLLSARRQELHRRAADWFGAQDLVLRAEHLDRAEDGAAPRAYLEAARAEFAQYRQQRALQLAERGLELAGDRPTQYAITCFHGDILRELGDSERSIKAFERALDTAADDVQRSVARIGLAEGMRILDRYDDALAVLDKAEAAATANNLVEELTRIHFLRGNLYFPLGNIDGCLEQHEAALKYAGEAGSLEDEARALGGLGDAYHQRGRMITANRHFDRCVELSREYGFGRIEVANVSMVGFTRKYSNELRKALEDGLEAIEAAAKVGHQRAELLGHILASEMLIEFMELNGARDHLQRSQNIIERIGARRFEAHNLSFLAKLARLEGRQSEALEMCERGLVVSRETGVGFVGPRVLAELALNTGDPVARRQSLKEGEDLLKAGVVSHNHFHFYRDSIEACLINREWDEAERYITALEDFARPEPLPWCDFFIARGRALKALGKDGQDKSTTQELRRLRDEAIEIGFKLYLPALESALAVAA